MKTFLGSVAEWAVGEYGFNEIGDVDFVFPNRRAGLFFIRELARVVGRERTIVLPKVYDINGFVESFSKLKKADDTELLLYLLKTYNEISGRDDSLRSFVEFGEKILHDFDEEDKYLVDVHKLYDNISDINQLRADIELSDEQREAVERLINVGTKDNGSLKFRENFVQIWRSMGELYDKFTERLKQNGVGYEGLIYREVCGRNDEDVTQRRAVFVGFNVLTTSEEAFINKFERAGKGKMIFDYGKVARDGSFSNYRQKIADFGFVIPDNMTEHPAMTAAEQAERVGEIVRELIDGSSVETTERNTAIVLADETLLTDTLAALPAGIEHINVTMGYPLRNTPIATLVNALIYMQTTICVQGSKRTIYHKPLMDVLLHPYAGYVCNADKAGEMVRKMTQSNIIRVDIEDLCEVDGRLFQPADDMLGYLMEVCDRIEEATGENQLQREYIREYRRRLTLLKTYTQETGVQIDKGETASIIRKMARSMKVQFKGEPLKGLQVMGLLECRLLDFENVIFVGFNDQYVPGVGVSDNSIVPYNMRKPFGLPTHEITNFIYAYNFYRMMNRCSRLDMIYNMSTGEMSKNEPSRFLLQMKYLYGKEVKVRHASVAEFGECAGIEPYRPGKEMWKTLDHISPSSLKDFINCPLKFFYGTLMGLQSDEEIDEGMKANKFGDLLHGVMEEYYTNGGLKDPDAAFRKVYKKVMHREYEERGVDIIAHDAVVKMAISIISYDENERRTFRVEACERKFAFDFSGMKISGKIDRIDTSGDEVVVIDYKTSRGTEKIDIERMFRIGGAKLEDNEAMQVLMYCLALKKMKMYEGKTFRPVLYKTYELMKPKKERKEITIQPYDDVSEEFEKGLMQTIEEITKRMESGCFEMRKEAEGYVETQQDKTCEYCDFRKLCNN